MPEMPEVESLRRFLENQIVDRVIARVELAAFSALKTFNPPLSALNGLTVTSVERRGKFIAIDADGVWLVFHLARAGWLRWRENIAPTPAKPGKGPLALRFVTETDAGFDLTEAGTQKKLAIYVVTQLDQVPGIAALGPDPLAADFDVDSLTELLKAAGRSQLKGVLRDQKILAGIGNAYSDEILHAARLSPFKPASGLSVLEVQTLYDAMRGELSGAIARAEGLAAKDLKGEKKTGMRVHGRAGLPCPVCGTDVAEVSFADSSLQYCPTCQTGGKLLADRRMSRLLR